MIAQDLPDLFGYNGFHYLLCVDYYSKWIEVANLDNLTSRDIICHLKSENLLGMGCLMSLSVTMGHNMSVQHLLISARAMVLSMPHPHFPEANGEAERAVQTTKNLLKKAQDSYKVLLNDRNTPLEGIKFSPAQLLMGRRLKTSLPARVDLLKPQRSQQIEQHFQKRKERL